MEKHEESFRVLEKIGAAGMCGIFTVFLFVNEYNVPLVTMTVLFPLVSICAYILIHHIDKFVQNKKTKV